MVTGFLRLGGSVRLRVSFVDRPRVRTLPYRVGRLNELNGRDWVRLTLSAVVHVSDRGVLRSASTAITAGAMLSSGPARSALKREHPATFAEGDVARFVRFFTRSTGVVIARKL